MNPSPDDLGDEAGGIDHQGDEQSQVARGEADATDILGNRNLGTTQHQGARFIECDHRLYALRFRWSSRRPEDAEGVGVASLNLRFGSRQFEAWHPEATVAVGYYRPLEARYGHDELDPGKPFLGRIGRIDELFT